MALTVRDAEDSYLQAKATVEDWQADVMAQWLKPELDLMLIMFWSQLDPVVKQHLRQQNPAAVAQVEQQAKAAKEAYTYGPG